MILGPPGSGKSQLATELSARLGLAVLRMDDLYWEAGWTRPSQTDFADRLRNVLCRAEWILDGNYFASVEERWRHADAAVYVDAPGWLCLLRIARRGIGRVFGDHDSLPERIRTPLSYPDPFFVWKVSTFNWRTRGPMLKLLRRCAGGRPIIIVSSCRGWSRLG
jgi:adenylate kinase family enzyme